MKPLYWKFLLILGAMIVGVSLAVPKALRKNTVHNVGSASQTLFLTDLGQNRSFDTHSVQSDDIVITVGKVKYLSALYNTKFSKLSFAMAIRYIAVGNNLSYPLNAGTLPTKSRVIDRHFVSV